MGYSFKFGTIVSKDFFTNKKFEYEKLAQIISHYTQQLAFHLWMMLERNVYFENIVNETIESIILQHDNDYERLWNTFNHTDKTLLIELAFEQTNLLSSNALYKKAIASSTVFSALKRLTTKGILIKTEKYEIDDPFFKKWIANRRAR